MSLRIIGIDIGGTNIKALALAEDGAVLRESLVRTQAETGANWLANVRKALADVCDGAAPADLCIGIAAPGLAAPSRESIAHMPGRLAGLEGLIWKEALQAVHAVPVLNDAQAALLGEAWLGAARGSANAILLTLGTGVGGAAIVDGRLLRGHLGRAGHLGHISLNPAGGLDVANTPGSIEDAIGDCTVAARTSGRFSATSQLVAAVRAGDADARRIWLVSIQALAAAISSFINILDPEVVVIGGGIAQAGATLFEPLQKSLDRFEWRPGGHKVRVIPAELGDRAGAFGAARAALDLIPRSRA